ncbi:hypothetical protein AAVH_19180 [Aphelenchoides avenae]|nr:hypothetical protein AAVH_19180 [Aphelenchus avenae]
MAKLLFQEEGADVHFIIGDPDKLRGSTGQRGEVEVPDADPEALESVLRYVYTDEMLLNMEDAMGILYLAKKYMLKPLVDGTARYIAEHMTPEKVCLFLDCADVLDDIKKKYDVLFSYDKLQLGSELGSGINFSGWANGTRAEPALLGSSIPKST